MGPGLGQSLRLGLESLPRLARSGRPKWSGGLGTLGARAGVGAAAATARAVGAWGSADVEPDDRCLGILEQRNMDSGLTPFGERGRDMDMSGVPSRQARLAHAAKHAELWNAGKKDEWVASWRTICPGEVRMFDPVGTEEKHGFDTALAPSRTFKWLTA